MSNFGETMGYNLWAREANLGGGGTTEQTPIDTILSERQKTHGDFADVAVIHQSLLYVMENSRNWKSLPPSFKTALNMDAMKTARILCGNYLHVDSWEDKAGYATLIAIEISSHPSQG